MSEAIEEGAHLAHIGAGRLWISYHDYAGVARGKAVATDRMGDALAHGIGWAKANWDFTAEDHQVPDPGFAADSGDFRLVPDPAAMWPLPHRPGVALTYGWLTEPDGTPWPEGDPRARLRLAEDTLAGRGIRAMVGMEAEFAVFQPTESGAVPADHERMFVQSAMDARWDLLGAVLDGLETMGIPAHQIAKEYGPGQYELSLLPAAPLAAADRYLAARDLVKALARDRGLIATFMPKPRADLAGNGLHVHLGLVDGTGRDVLGDPEQPDRFSNVGGWALAGLLAHAAAQLGLGAPTPNSYKRLLPGSWAPAHACWGIGNRSALIRVPAPGPGRHLEYRSGDGSANVYLHLAGLLAAIGDGVERCAPPPPPVAMDIGHLTDADAAAAGAPRLPSRLDAALDALEVDATLGAALGATIREHYLAVKRAEWSSYVAASGLDPDDTAVSDWERATYLELL